MAENKLSILITAKDQTAAAFDSVNKSLGRANSALASFGVALSAAGIGAFIKQGIDAADEMGKLAQKVGLTTEALSGLKYAGALSDVSIEQLGTGLKILSKNMIDTANGTGEAKDSFKTLGINVQDASGKLKTGDAILLEVAERFGRMEDGAGKTALAMRIFGKSGSDLIPMLNAGRAGIQQMADEAKRFGLVISDEAAKAAEEFNDNLTRLQSQMSGLGIGMANDVLPTLNAVVYGFQNLAGEAHDIEGAFSPLKTLLEAVSILGLNVVYTFQGVGRELGGIAAQAGAIWSMKGTGLNPEDWREVAAIRKEMIRDNESAAKRLVELEDRIMNPKKYAQKPTKQASGTYELSTVTRKEKKLKTEKLDEIMSGADKQYQEYRRKQIKDENDWRLAEERHLQDTLNAYAAEGFARYEGALDLDKDIAGRLQAITQDAFGDGYSNRFDAVQKQLMEDIKRLEAVRSSMSEEGAGNMLAAINTWADAAYKQAEIEGAMEHISQADEARQQRIATLSAQVTAGIKTQDESRREGIGISREALAAMEPHLTLLQRLATAGYPPAIAAMQKYQAQLVELQDAARDKNWMDGIRAGLKDYAGTSIDTFKTAADAVKSGFKSMEDALTGFVLTGKLDFKSLADSIISDMVRIMVQQSITKPLAEAGASFFSSFFASAKGNVFNAPGLSAYSGQIISQPTVFPFASGIGLMGEAGPEAIMPLKRGPDGTLGVRGGGSNVTVNVINNASGAQASQQSRQDGNGNTVIDVMIEQIKGAIAGDIARGSGAVPAAIERTYGANRVAGAY